MIMTTFLVFCVLSTTSTAMGRLWQRRCTSSTRWVGTAESKSKLRCLRFAAARPNVLSDAQHAGSNTVSTTVDTMQSPCILHGIIYRVAHYNLFTKVIYSSKTSGTFLFLCFLLIKILSCAAPGAFYLNRGLKWHFLFSIRFGLLLARPWLCSRSTPVILGCSAVTVVKIPISGER